MIHQNFKSREKSALSVDGMKRVLRKYKEQCEYFKVQDDALPRWLFASTVADRFLQAIRRPCVVQWSPRSLVHFQSPVVW